MLWQGAVGRHCFKMGHSLRVDVRMDAFLTTPIHHMCGHATLARTWLTFRRDYLCETRVLLMILMLRLLHKARDRSMQILVVFPSYFCRHHVGSLLGGVCAIAALVAAVIWHR